MKRILSLILSLAMIVSIFAGMDLTVFAASKGTLNGLKYTIENGEVTITEYTGSATNLVIRSEIENCPVTEISDMAFYECTKLESVIIPESIIRIGNMIFNRCSNLKTVIVDSNNITYYSSGNCIIRASDDILIAACENSTIPNGVKGIGYGAFYECLNYTSITIPEGVTHIDELSFSYCENLESITIPDSVIEIGDYAFTGCTSLASIIIPKNLSRINDYTFYYCDNLESIIIPKSVKSIGYKAFEKCYGLTTVYFDGTIQEWNSIDIRENNWYLTKADIVSLNSGSAPVPDGLEYSINNNEVTIDKYTGNAAEIVIPSEIQGYPVTWIGHDCFSGCTTLKRVILPESLTNISGYSFSDCTNLESITIPNGVKRLVYGAFSGCTNLVTINLPEGMTSIMPYSFNGTAYYNDSNNWEDGLLYIGTYLIGADDTTDSDYYIKEGTTLIAGGTFANKSNVASITIPDTVVYIGPEAFYNFTGSTTIYYCGTESQWNNIEIDNFFNEYLLNANIIFNATPAIPDIPVLTPGDLSGDEEINAKDSNLFKRVLAGDLAVEADSPEFLAVDLNSDGILNAKDANLLKQILAGAIQI
ncbi:MAG: leucine-rich repeat protein [Clostridia bacterium]|nr:leucine-rich repeat protein [Clostridia bacterium]